MPEEAKTAIYSFVRNQGLSMKWPERIELPIGEFPQIRNRADLFGRVESSNLSLFRFYPTSDLKPFDVDTKNWDEVSWGQAYLEKLTKLVEARMNRKGLVIIFD